jgi:hypothetical protein
LAVSDPIVDPSDLEALLGSAVDVNRASTLIELAQQLAESIVSPLPLSARAVVLSVAARAYSNPQNVQAQTVGPYTAQYGSAASGGLYLSRQDRASLKRLAGRGGAFSIDPLADDAGAGLAPWDQNVTWLTGVPLVEDTDR